MKTINRKSTDEFIRLAGVIKKHFEDEGIPMDDYEIGHFAIMFQDELSKLKEKIIDQLKTNESHAWNDADHCSCLKYAISMLEGDED